MGINAGPLVITDSLTVRLDPANSKSYSGAGTAFTSVTSGIGGTVEGTSTYSSSNKGTVSLSGTSQIVTALVTSNSSNHSVAIWFKTSSADGKKLVGFESSTLAKTSGNYNNSLYMGSDGKIYFGFWDGAAKVSASLTTLNDNIWHLAVGTVDMTAKEAKLYIDGIYNSNITTAGTIQTFTGYWRFGGYKLNNWTNGSDGYSSATIGPSTIYSRVLTSTEILKNYNALKKRFDR